MKSAYLSIVLAICLTVQTGSAQVIPGDANLVTLDLSSGSLMVTGGQAVVIAGLPGRHYRYFYVPGNSGMLLDPPDANGNQNPGDLVWEVSGRSSQNVVFEFNLPHAFSSLSTGAVIPISYDDGSASFDNGSGTFYSWNPAISSPPINIGSATGGKVYLGFGFFVPPTAPPADDYLALFYMSVQSTGF
jgi:hypothetical protein